MLNYTKKVQADILSCGNGEKPARHVRLGMHAFNLSAVKAHVAHCNELHECEKSSPRSFGKKSTGETLSEKRLVVVEASVCAACFTELRSRAPERADWSHAL